MSASDSQSFETILNAKVSNTVAISESPLIENDKIYNITPEEFRQKFNCIWIIYPGTGICSVCTGTNR